MVKQEFLFHVPSSELENRVLSGVVQTYKAGRRKSVCWFNRNIIKEDVLYGVAVSELSVLLLNDASSSNC